MNIYIILAVSLVVFILLVLIIKNRSESKHRISYKDRAVLDKIVDGNSQKDVKTIKTTSNTRADSFKNKIPETHKSEKKISLNDNVLLENIAKIIDTKLGELGGKAETPKKELGGTIEERINKNGKKYYYNTETNKFAKKSDFEKQQKDNVLVDETPTEEITIKSTQINNQKYEIAKNVVSSEERGRESVPSSSEDVHQVDTLVAEKFSIKSVEIDNQKYEFGLKLLEKKKFNQAIYYFNKAIELNPADGAPYYYRGIAKTELNLLNDAIEDYTDAMLQKLNFVDVFYKRGNCKFKLGDTIGALKDFTKYVSIDKHNPEAYYYKGLLEYDAGNYSDVIKDLNRAIELNPNHESAYFKRGMAKEKTGDKKGCINDLKTAVEKGNLEAYHYLKKFSN